MKIVVVFFNCSLSKYIRCDIYGGNYREQWEESMTTDHGGGQWEESMTTDHGGEQWEESMTTDHGID
jgi:hypothetical protein